MIDYRQSVNTIDNKILLSFKCKDMSSTYSCEIELQMNELFKINIFTIRGQLTSLACWVILIEIVLVTRISM